MMNATRHFSLFALVFALISCAQPAPELHDWQHGGEASKPLSKPVAYVAHSEAWKQSARETYRHATQYIEKRSADFNPETWVVVLDLDQTVMNNIGYHIAQDKAGAEFNPNTWSSWVEARKAELIPGAQAFIARVNKLGGHVVFVTNRRDYEAVATEDNLAALGIVEGRDYAVMLTRGWPDAPSDKESRFASIGLRLSELGYPTTTTIAYIGDVVGDQPKNLNGAEFFCVPQGGIYGENCTP